MRKKLVEEQKKNEEVVILKKKIEIDLQEKLIEQIKKQREFDKKNVTSDYQGNVVMIKGTPTESLVVDFLQPKILLKDTEKIENVSKTKRDTLRTINPVNLAKLESDNRKSIHKRSVFVSNNDKNNQREQKYIQPSGSNFDFISAETGVKITEGGKVKTGSTDFSMHFGKPSKYDYQSLTNENRSHNNRRSSIFTYTNNSIEEYRQSPNFKLPSLNQNVNFQGENNKSSNKDSLKINKRLVGTVMETLDQLDLIKDYDENDLKNNINFDIFRKKTKIERDNENISEIKMNNLSSLDEINKFNFSIIKNSSWGIQSKSKIKVKNFKQYFKPNMKELENEIGKNVVIKKLPRSRVKSINLTDR